MSLCASGKGKQSGDFVVHPLDTTSGRFGPRPGSSYAGPACCLPWAVWTLSRYSPGYRRQT